jgi:hypothetical protein
MTRNDSLAYRIVRKGSMITRERSQKIEEREDRRGRCKMFAKK